MARRWLWLRVLPAALGGLVVACSPGAPGLLPAATPTSAPVALAPTLAPRPTPQPSRNVVTIDAAEQYFYPEQVSVRVGTTVVWNDVQGTHDMVAEDKSFASAVLFEGGSYSHTFTTPGHYHYVCTLHLGAGMWADIDVVP